MLYMRSIDLGILHNYNFVPFDQHLPISPTSLPPILGNHCYTLCFYVFDFFSFHMQGRSRSFSLLREPGKSVPALTPHTDHGSWFLRDTLGVQASFTIPSELIEAFVIPCWPFTSSLARPSRLLGILLLPWGSSQNAALIT